MAGFSLGSIIEANQQFLSTQEIASGGTVSGPAQPFFQRHEEAIVQIEPSSIPASMAALQADVERSLADHGLKIVGRESDRQVDGIVNLSGVRGQETGLILIAIMTESPKI